MTCSGVDPNVDITSSGNLMVIFDNERVTTFGVLLRSTTTHSLSLSVDQATLGASSIHSNTDEGILIRSNGGNVSLTTIANATVSSDATDAIQLRTTGAGTVTISTGDNVTAGGTGSAILARSVNGNITIDATAGLLQATAGEGITAVTTGAGDLNLSLSGGQVAANIGIRGRADGTGDVELTAATGTAIAATQTGCTPTSRMQRVPPRSISPLTEG